MQREPLPKINFSALAEALLRDVDQLLPRWLPGGAFHKPEYVCGSLSGGEGKSCSVNVVTGLWSDFSTGEGGRDLLSLYAAIHDLSQAKAAVQVAHEEGLQSVANIVSAAPTGTVAAPPRPPPPPKPPGREKETWTGISPAPAHHLQPTFWHHEYNSDGKGARTDHVACYRVGETLYGYVVRFVRTDGSKVPMPYTYARSDRDGSETWKWRGWAEPRPLYFPGARLPEGRTVVLVEGERKADCLHALLEAGAPGVYCVVSWPGGSNAWAKADWTWLAGCTVIAWPDCDSLREKLTREEVKATPDPLAQEVLRDAKPFLAAKDQPGQKAMLGIGALLRDSYACTVQLLPIEKPGVLPSGWDCRDAIETDGWDFARVQGYFATARALLADVSAAGGGKGGKGGKGDGGGKGPSGDGPAAAGGGDGWPDGDAFSEHLAYIAEQMAVEVWELQPNRKMIVAALRKSPWLDGRLAFDELRGAPCTREAWPWRDKPAPLVDQDDLRLGDFIEQTYKVKSPSRAALSEAIELVADGNRYHPIREWLADQAWDEKPRLEKWLIHVLGHDPNTMDKKLRRYLELVGKLIVLGQVYRVMEPGCKFDYSVVLEGITGMGKSTMVRTLVGEEFFSDTHFDIGAGKDGMEQLAGIWAYELSEMTAFRRADSEAVKQFFSTQKDRYRGAYGRYVQDHPRQVVIWCTTNKRQYLYDVTGNRRFWPIWVQNAINIAWIAKWRGQLFAEAMELFRKREPAFPSPEDERLYFKPEQEKRLVETGVQSRLFDLLTRDGAPQSDTARGTAAFSKHTSFVTVADLVVALGTDPGKSNNLLETQIRDWLMENGWSPKREASGQRRRGYSRPDVWPPKFEDEPPPPNAAPVALDGGGGEGSAAGDVPQWTGGDDYAPI